MTVTDERLALEHLAMNYVGAERTWVAEMAAFARESGRPELSVVLEAAVSTYRSLQDYGEMIEHQRQTIVRQARELRDLKTPHAD